MNIGGSHPWPAIKYWRTQQLFSRREIICCDCWMLAFQMELTASQSLPTTYAVNETVRINLVEVWLCTAWME